MIIFANVSLAILIKRS